MPRKFNALFWFRAERLAPKIDQIDHSTRVMRARGHETSISWVCPNLDTPKPSEGLLSFEHTPDNDPSWQSTVSQTHNRAKTCFYAVARASSRISPFPIRGFTLWRFLPFIRLADALTHQTHPYAGRDDVLAARHDGASSLLCREASRGFSPRWRKTDSAPWWRSFLTGGNAQIEKISG